MPFITKADLATHIYAEGIATISREDDLKIQEAILSAQQEAALYLSRYNVQTIFDAVDPERANYTNLITYIKDIAKWHFIAVANVTVDLDLARERYELAIKALVQISRIAVPGWPLFQEDSNRPFRSGSNIKFNHLGF